MTVIPSNIIIIETESGLPLELESGADIIETENSVAGAAAYDELPVYPVPYIYMAPSSFYQGEPDDQVNPAYFEAWQNLSTQLMPEYYPRDLEGLYAAGMTGGAWEVMQLSTPVFDVDGVGVVGPTQATLDNDGAGTIEQVGPSA